MKKKKSVLIIVLCVIFIVAAALAIYFILDDKNKLTVEERNWINENISTVQNVNILNNANVFGKNGSGVFYDFINAFEDKYGLTINPITFNKGTTTSGIVLNEKNKKDKNDIVIYEDHYVLVGKTKELILNEEDISGKSIGVLSSDLSYVSSYIRKASNITYTEYLTREELINSLTEVNSYIIVPLMDYIDTILSNNYHIIYHFSDATSYFTLSTNDDYLSKVLKKFYNTWKDEFESSFNANLFTTFKTSLNLADTDIDAMQAIVYNYGFVNASPYEVITGGKYGGIVAVILSKFSSFADVEFNFEKYSNFKEFNKAIKNNKIDLYFNYYNFNDSYKNTKGLLIDYVVAAPRDENTVIKSIYSLVGKTVYVQENSKIYDYVNSINGINVKTFSTMKDLFKLNKKDVYLVIDKNTFEYYSDKKLDNYTKRYSDSILNEYTFKVKDEGVLYQLLSNYISIFDRDELVLEGIENHYETMKSGSIITKIAEYILYAIIILIIVALIIIKKSKKISIARKIKKDDKLKFIDQLTSLKNRNFLNENIETWNNNTIYPQTIIVIDLNKVQEINDIYGYNEGDKQIKALANVLIKSQLDNSEIIRTDGNEFVIYLVGYSQKQISNYIHKLNKEIKKLPYDFGAEFGYSMILDDIKTIEDALNEAVEDMKKQKESKSDEKAKA